MNISRTQQLLHQWLKIRPTAVSTTAGTVYSEPLHPSSTVDGSTVVS